jgi:Flp pilus assembly pilin Flp
MDKDDVIGLGLVVALIALALCGSLWLVSAQCRAQWEGSGLKSEWSLIGGCKVQRKDGTWMPSKAIREVAP